MLGINTKIIMSSLFITLLKMQDETKFLILCRGLSPSSSIVRQCHVDEFQTFPFIGINNVTVIFLKLACYMGG